MRKNLRLTYIIPSLSNGGAENQTIIQLNELSDRHIKCQIIILSDADELLSKLSNNIDHATLGIKTAATLNKSLIVGILKNKKRIRQEIKQFAPSDIICIMPAAFFAGRMALKNQGKQCPNLWLYHRSTEYLINPANTLFKKIFKFFIEKNLLKKDSGHLYISNAVKYDIEKNENPKLGYTLFNALKKIEIKEAEARLSLEQHNITPGSYYIFPGRLHWQKGHQLFLKAAKEIIIKNRLTILIVGNGPLRKDIEESIKALQLETFIKLTGEIPHHNVLELFKTAKGTIIPSLYEGFGNVAIESIMLGTPVFCSDAGGLKEIINNKKTGITFRANDPDDLREKFAYFNQHCSVLNKAEIEADFLNRFTIEKQVDKLLQILNNH